MRARFIALLLIVHLPSAAAAQHVPTVDDLLNVKTAGGAHISPDGKWVAYTVSEADFKQNAFITQVWLANAATGRSVQLTRGEKSATSPQWSPDSDANSRLAIIPIDGGLPRSITDTFDESPDIVAWNAAGLFFSGSQKTATHVFRVDPTAGTFTRVTQPDALMLAAPASRRTAGRSTSPRRPRPR